MLITENWTGMKQAVGGTTWTLEQARTANTVNEITDITNSVGSAWAEPTYDPTGNMQVIPQPGDPTQSRTGTWDAWNRLVKLIDDSTSDTAAEYEYDGAKRRIIEKSYASGTLSETRQLYYSEPSKWQVIEERLGTSTDPDRQNVWGLRYVDDIVLRDRDTTSNGTLDERLYGLQDANWNVTAITNASGTVQERYAYSAYGAPMFLTPSFGTRSSSDFDWIRLYAGYRWSTIGGLYNVRNRVYDPVVGACMQRDPLGLQSCPNLYQYSLSNPVDLLDPFGLTSTYPVAPHGNGGPLDPVGNISCKDSDTCAALRSKLATYIAAIISHKQWDSTNPTPGYPNGRHSQEIEDYERGVNRCTRLISHKCHRRPKTPTGYCPVTVPSAQPSPGRFFSPFSGWVILAAVSAFHRRTEFGSDNWRSS